MDDLWIEKRKYSRAESQEIDKNFQRYIIHNKYLKHSISSFSGFVQILQNFKIVNIPTSNFVAMQKLRRKLRYYNQLKNVAFDILVFVQSEMWKWLITWCLQKKTVVVSFLWKWCNLIYNYKYQRKSFLVWL